MHQYYGNIITSNKRGVIQYMKNEKFIVFWEKEMKKGYKHYIITRILVGDIVYFLSTILAFMIVDYPLVLSLRLSILYIGALFVVTIIMYISNSSKWTASQYRYNTLTSKKNDYKSS